MRPWTIVGPSGEQAAWISGRRRVIVTGMVIVGVRLVVLLDVLGVVLGLLDDGQAGLSDQNGEYTPRVTWRFPLVDLDLDAAADGDLALLGLVDHVLVPMSIMVIVMKSTTANIEATTTTVLMALS